MIWRRIAVGALVGGAASVAIAVWRHDGAFHRPLAPGVTIATCAAYDYEPAKTGAVVVDASGSAGDVVTFRDHPYNVHRGDCLRAGAADVATVLWHREDARAWVGIRLTGAAAVALPERSRQRISQDDALFVDGTLITVSLYDNVMDDTLWLSSKVDDERPLFVRLTGVQPPD